MKKSTSFVLSVALFAAYSEPALGAGDAAKGKEVFAKCAVCHQIGRDAGTQVGPELNGIVGRKAASVDYPMYSDELKTLGELGVVWTEENIDKLVANPKTILPHSPMSVFPGVPEASDRADLIAYLKTEPSRRD